MVPQIEEIELLCLGVLLLCPGKAVVPLAGPFSICKAGIVQPTSSAELWRAASSSIRVPTSVQVGWTESLQIHKPRLGAWDPCPSGRRTLGEGPRAAPCLWPSPPKGGCGWGRGGSAPQAALAGYNTELSRGFRG